MLCIQKPKNVILNHCNYTLCPLLFLIVHTEVCAVSHGSKQLVY